MATVKTVSADRLPGRKRDERTDGLLIDAVLDLVSEGATLSGLSLVMIAERAGVSRNSLYRRWQTKGALYLDVLASINRPMPELPGRSAREDLEIILGLLIERTIDDRARRMLRALTADAAAFPDLQRRYYAEVVQPRRDKTLHALQRGIKSGEVSEDTDLNLAADLLVDPIITRVSTDVVNDLDPVLTSRRLVDLVFRGLTPRER
jgi:AcrR family transcriptional regulator